MTYICLQVRPGEIWITRFCLSIIWISHSTFISSSRNFQPKPGFVFPNTNLKLEKDCCFRNYEVSRKQQMKKWSHMNQCFADWLGRMQAHLFKLWCSHCQSWDLESQETDIYHMPSICHAYFRFCSYIMKKTEKIPASISIYSSGMIIAIVIFTS